MIEDMKLEILEIPIISVQNLFLEKLDLQQLQKISGSNIWFSHFKLNVLEGDMVAFTRVCLFSALEGEAKFSITLYNTISPRHLIELLDPTSVPK